MIDRKLEHEKLTQSNDRMKCDLDKLTCDNDRQLQQMSMLQTSLTESQSVQDSMQTKLTDMIEEFGKLQNDKVRLGKQLDMRNEELVNLKDDNNALRVAVQVWKQKLLHA